MIIQINETVCAAMNHGEQKAFHDRLQRPGEEPTGVRSSRSNRTTRWGGCPVVMWLIQERPPGAVVRAWCPKRSEEDVLWVRVAAGTG
jgi:hypothetical protein